MFDSILTMGCTDIFNLFGMNRHLSDHVNEYIIDDMKNNQISFIIKKIGDLQGKKEKYSMFMNLQPQSR